MSEVVEHLPYLIVTYEVDGFGVNDQAVESDEVWDEDVDLGVFIEDWELLLLIVGNRTELELADECSFVCFFTKTFFH